MPPETLHWKHLFDEVVTSGRCTGCAGRVACAHDVLGYKDTEGVYKPVPFGRGVRPRRLRPRGPGRTSCTRPCPRFRTWEPEIDQFLFGRPRSAIEVEGVTKDVILTRASDDKVDEVGQVGGLMSAILIWAMSMATSTPPSSPISRATGRRGGRFPGWPGPRSRSWRRPAAVTPTAPTPWPTPMRLPDQHASGLLWPHELRSASPRRSLRGSRW